MKFFYFLSFVFMSLCAASTVLSSSLEEGEKAFDAGQYEAAMKVFSQEYKAGNTKAGYYLARMLDLGLGIESDKIAAKDLYLQAAQAGNAEALNRLAMMYYHGEMGVLQNYEEAARYFDLSAKQGDRNALFNLGKLYFEGKGVKKDISVVLNYYKQAASKDHILALNTLGALYRDGAINKEDKSQAKLYFQRSALFGNAVGLFETARLILEEKIDQKSQVQAHVYLNLASARYHPQAPQALRELTVLMDEEDVKIAQVKAHNFVALTDEGVQ